MRLLYVHIFICISFLHQSKERWVQSCYKWGICLALWQWQQYTLKEFQILEQIETTELLNYVRTHSAFYVITVLWTLISLSFQKRSMKCWNLLATVSLVLSLSNIENIFSQISGNGGDGFMLSSVGAHTTSHYAWGKDDMDNFYQNR